MRATHENTERINRFSAQGRDTKEITHRRQHRARRSARRAGDLRARDEGSADLRGPADGCVRGRRVGGPPGAAHSVDINRDLHTVREPIRRPLEAEIARRNWIGQQQSVIRARPRREDAVCSVFVCSAQWHGPVSDRERGNALFVGHFLENPQDEQGGQHTDEDDGGDKSRDSNIKLHVQAAE